MSDYGPSLRLVSVSRCLQSGEQPKWLAAPMPESLIGSTIEGSSFSGLLT